MQRKGWICAQYGSLRISVISFIFFYSREINAAFSWLLPDWFLGLDNPYIRENENFIFFLELIGAHLGSALVNTLVEQHLKQKNKELEHKNMFLDTLCQEYTSVYYVDLDACVGEVIKVDSGANAAKFIKAPNKTMIAYMPMLKAYAESYVIEEDRDYFLARLETHALKEELLKEEWVLFRYRSLPNSKTHKNFEVHAIRAEGQPHHVSLLPWTTPGGADRNAAHRTLQGGQSRRLPLSLTA